MPRKDSAMLAKLVLKGPENRMKKRERPNGTQQTGRMLSGID